MDEENRYLKEFEKFMEEMVSGENKLPNESVSEKNINPELPIEEIAISVTRTRVFNLNVPFIERHMLIAKTSNGYFSLNYERNKENPTIKIIDDLRDLQFKTRFYAPKDGTTMSDLNTNVGKFYIFSQFRYIRKVLPTLFDSTIVWKLEREWAGISLFQRKMFDFNQFHQKIIQSIKGTVNHAAEQVLSCIRKIFSWFFQ